MFGPHPREYRLSINRKVKRLARASALNARAREHAIRVIEPLQFEEPKTRRVAELLGRMGIADRRVLMLTEAVNPNLILSARNLQNVEVMRYRDASTYDILRAEALLIEEPAFGSTLEQGGDAAAIAPPEPKAKAKRVKAAPAPEKKPAKKAAPAPKAKPVAKKAEPKKPKSEPKQAKADAKPAAAKKAEPAKAEKKPETGKPEAKKGKTGKKPGKKE
jgi:outer membrane biosynthesis protein TonB